MLNVMTSIGVMGLAPIPQITIPVIESKYAGTEVTVTVMLENGDDVGAVSYQWAQVMGDDVVFTGQGTPQIQFVAPTANVAQNIVFTLIAANSDGGETEETISVPILSVVAGVTEVRPYEYVKAKLLSSDCRANVTLHQHSDNYIYCEVLSTQGVVINPDNFPKLEYKIADMEGKAVITLTHENGIRKHMDGFLIHIDDKTLTDDIIGKYKHQLVVFNISDDKLPPVFTGKATVKAVIH